MTQDGFFKKAEYVYDEYFDCYVCPNDQVLAYHTTNRSGYREYKSCGIVCEGCPYLKQCTESRDHVKVVTRHIWEPYMEKCEDIRHTIGMKEVYAQRKETVERLFGTAKENHGFRYTQMIGKARMEMKVGLTFACMNLKKLAKMIARKGKRGTQKCLLLIKYILFEPKTRKTLLVSTPEAKRREMGNLVHHFQTEEPSVCDIDFDFFYCLAHTSDAVQILDEWNFNEHDHR